MMRRLYRLFALLIMMMSALGLSAQYAEGLFFSEYVEGSSFNKALEIFNGTGQTVDLSQYTIKLAANGGSWHGTNILHMTGSLDHNQTYVVAHPQANTAILAVADVTSQVANHNGNDAFGLFLGETIIDMIGIYQNDPGQGWPVAGVPNGTLNHTLIRKPHVTSGTLDWDMSAGTNAEDSQWIVEAQDYFGDLGSHTFAPNTGNMVATPSFDPPAGVYTQPISVTISCATDGASIYYSTDGSTPNASSTLYTAPIAISTSTSLKAIAMAPEMDASIVATANYSFPVNVPSLSVLASSPADGSTIYHLSGEVVLTFQQPFRNQKFVQDSGAGILIDDDNGVITSTYNIGDGITGIMGKMSEYGGMLQFVPTSNPGVATSSGNPIVPIVVSFDNLYNHFNTYRSRVVKVMGVEFENASGNFANGIVYPVYDQDTEYDIRTTFYDVDYIGTPIPVGERDIIGIPNSRPEGNFFTPRWLSDFEGAVATPVFSPPAGTYMEPINVSITCATDGATIRYTTDGSTPSESSTLYNAPIQIASNTTLKAIAYATGMPPSAVMSAEYNFPVVVANLSELRNAPLDGLYRVQGEVILSFQQSYRNQKFVQDDAAGILIDDYNGVITQGYQIGDGITGLVGTTMEFGGMFEFVPTLNSAPASSTGNALQPLPITLAQFVNNFEEWESRLVSIQGVRFEPAAGDFANGAVYQILDELNYEDGEFRSTFYDVDYIGLPKQSWMLNISGIPNSREDGIYISARTLADFQINDMIAPLVFEHTVEDVDKVSFTMGFAAVNNINIPHDLSGYRLYRNGEIIHTADAAMSVSFTDEDIPVGEHSYHAKAIYGGGIESPATQAFSFTVTDADDPILPVAQTALKGNWPNPFNPSTTIAFELKEAANASLEIYNLKGQKVRSLANAHYQAGAHKVVWDGCDDAGRVLSSGVYWVKMNSGSYHCLHKIVMMK
ncbi:MAG: chitobiase/beta-hexosaminidase C-terminal domain-containing protein [Candidatus Cloacimonadaceae bacterium]